MGGCGVFIRLNSPHQHIHYTAYGLLFQRRAGLYAQVLSPEKNSDDRYEYC